MRAAIGSTSLRSLAMLIAVSLAGSAWAQDTGSPSDYRLPEPTQTRRPPQTQGPVDPDNPYALPSSATRPDSVPTPTPTPQLTLPAPTPSGVPTRPARTQRPARPSQARATPTPEPSMSDVAGTPALSPVPVITAPPAPPAVDDASASSVASKQSKNGNTVWLVVGAAGLILAAGAVLFLRRRKRVPDEIVEPAPASPEPQPSPPARTAAGGVARPQPTPGPIPSAPSAVEPFPLATAFTAQAVRLSLVYATLQYELEVANAGIEPLPPLQVCADLSSAHASIGTREQLAPAPEQLEAKHAVPALAPGETAVLKGELRLSLQQIRAHVKGSAHFFVPLARFCILAPDGNAVRRVFTLGPQDAIGGTGIASVRLDAGPRNLRDLAAREIEAARGLALDPVSTAG